MWAEAMDKGLTGVRTEAIEKRGGGGQRPSLDPGRKKRRHSLGRRGWGWGPTPAMGRRKGDYAWVPGGGAWPGPRVQEGLAWATRETSLAPQEECGSPA